jgi:hypothetical protein
MSDPQRLVDGAADEFERALLASTRLDEGAQQSIERALLVFGELGTTSIAAGMTAHTGAIGHARRGLALLGKFIAVGAVVGAASVGAGKLVTARRAHAPAPVMSINAKSVDTARPDPPGSATPDRAASAVSPDPSPTPGPSSGVRSSGEGPSTLSAPPRARSTRGSPSAVPAPTDSTAGTPWAPAATASASARGLSDEIALLDATRAALARADGNQALRLLDTYNRDFAHPALGQEATLLRIEALLHAGRRAEAYSLARQIIARQPTGPHAARVRSLLGGSSIP